MSTTTLPPGTRLGPYEIESLLGAGGMGEVYQARDTRLGRTVAIKILAGGAPADDVGRTRFHNEARAISALGHPHIRTLYDVGTENGVDFLVMEYLEGHTLATLLRGRPLPLDRALRYAIEITEALSAAHRHGIIHCDIKPANIMVTGSGIKLLDFGIARLWSDLHSAATSSDATTATDRGDEGGTSAYMAPERFEGVPCDARGDVYALGVVLFELFTGRRPFQVQSKAQQIAAVRDSEPPSLTAINPEIPADLDHLVLKCLDRDPDARWQATADLAGELTWISQRSRGAAPAQRARFIPLIGAVAAIIIAAVVITLVASRMNTGAVARAVDPVRFLIDTSIGSTMSVNPGAFAVSPDGTSMAYTASIAGGKRVLWLRAMNAFEGRPLPGTDDAWNPFWNPDSKRIAFFAGNRVRSVDTQTGNVVTIGDLAPSTERGTTGSWSSTGDIVLATGPALLKMASDGTLTTLDESVNAPEVRYSGPSFLPDGQRFFYHLQAERPSITGLYLGTLDRSAPDRRLLDSDSQGIFTDPNFILYMKGGNLVAQRVKVDTLERIGAPMPLPGSVSFFSTINQAAFSSSRNNVLAYRAGVVESELRWYDRTGRVMNAAAPAGPYANPALSPDGTRVAVTRFDPAAGSSDIWTIDERGSLTQLTSAPTAEDFPMWEPGGERVLFSSNPHGPSDLYLKNWTAAAADPLVPFNEDPHNKMPFQWGTSNRGLLFLLAEPSGFLGGQFYVRAADGEMFRMPMTEEQQLRENGQPQLSPNGNWLAYVADITGSPHVFIRPYPHGEGRWLVSPAGGLEPRWRSDGRELFYLAPDRTLMALDVGTDSAPFIATPRPLFRTNLAGAYLGSAFPGNRVRNEYDVSPDAQRFLLNEPVEGESAYSVRVCLNWTGLLASP